VRALIAASLHAALRVHVRLRRRVHVRQHCRGRSIWARARGGALLKCRVSRSLADLRKSLAAARTMRCAGKSSSSTRMVTSQRVFSRYISSTPRSTVDACVAERRGVLTQFSRCRAGRSRLARCRATRQAMLSAPPRAPFSSCRHGRVAGASSSASLCSGCARLSPQASSPEAAASSWPPGGAAPPCTIQTAVCAASLLRPLPTPPGAVRGLGASG